MIKGVESIKKKKKSKKGVPRKQKVKRVKDGAPREVSSCAASEEAVNSDNTRNACMEEGISGVQEQSEVVNSVVQCQNELWEIKQNFPVAKTKLSGIFDKISVGAHNDPDQDTLDAVQVLFDMSTGNSEDEDLSPFILRRSALDTASVGEDQGVGMADAAEVLRQRGEFDAPVQPVMYPQFEESDQEDNGREAVELEIL